MSQTEPAVAPESAKGSGLSTWINVIVAPATAFEQLGRAPSWGWAALAGLIVTLIATIVAMPEAHRAFDIALQTRPANATAEQMAQAQGFLSVLSHAFPYVATGGVLIGIWFNWLFVALFFLLAALASRAKPSFGAAWAMTVNLYAISGLGQLVNSVILALRGPNAVNGPADIVTIPSLALLVHGPPKLVAALQTVTVFELWYCVVAALALERVMGVRRSFAIAIVVVLVVATALLAAWGRR